MPEKKQTNPLVYIGVGLLILLFLIGIGTTIFLRFFARRLIQGAIENRTGIKTNISDLEKGKVTFTDSKTGAKVDIGTGKVPDTFPKDFPLYPGAKVTSALSGAQSGKNNGFWLTMTATDSVDKVSAFYKSGFAQNGWTVENIFTSGNSTTESITKTGWSGSLAISADANTKETQIVIILGEDTATPTPTTPAGGE